MEQFEFDIAIIGGGHAGVEAIEISQQLGFRVALFTMKGVGIGSMPCNPAIGGVGKGQVVKEIDCLGGVMGRLADKAAIQYRTLNDSKGYAVQSTRAQIDKEEYTKIASSYIESLDGVSIIYGAVESVQKDKDLFEVVSGGKKYFSSKVVVTTGTFLNGKLHCGEEQTRGGRVDCDSSLGLLGVFKNVKSLGVRFKTGTPPRINTKTIDYTKLVEQKSDPATRNFSLLSEQNNRSIEQVSCFLSHTNEKTLGIIRENKERSPIFNGQVKGVGPRYCPSIEDKAFRYLDRNTHHVFLEPEGLSVDSVYPNGLSTSLPREVQKSFLKTISGLENIEVLVPGYAVEYDVVDTSMLSLGLEYNDIPGLYFAGQVNGTSGYEEAAAQGLIAGINACFSLLGRDLFILPRDCSYIGVMIEDLVTQKRDEPYRLFTARAENRLYIREDNAFTRMYPFRKSFGLSLEIDLMYERLYSEYEVLSDLCSNYYYYNNNETKERFEKLSYGEVGHNKLSLDELLTKSHIDPVNVLKNECSTWNISFHPDVIKCVAISKKYKGYINKADSNNKKIAKLDKQRVEWEHLLDSKNISFECKHRIKEIKPQTFGQLRKIDGIRPATLAFVAGSIF